MLHGNYTNLNADTVSYEKKFSKAEIIANAPVCAVECTEYIFHRFDWMTENVKGFLAAEQESFLKT